MNKNILKFLTAFLITILFISCITGCAGLKEYLPNNDTKRSNSGSKYNEIKYESSEEVDLPEPKLEKSMYLDEAISKRRSVRDFIEKDIEIEKISKLLWSAQGITKNYQGQRTEPSPPSAGALYPLDIFLVKKDGLFHYIPESHGLLKMSSHDPSDDIYKACLSQSAVREAAINIIITAVYERTTKKYGDRGIRYVHLEAGHACQNILLQSAALGLGAVPIGAFEDDRIIEVMKLPKNYIPLYVVAIGYPE